MSLYDDLDSKARTTEKVAAWSSGIKLLQSQMLLKKAAVTQPKRESMRRSTQVLPPVIDLKSKQRDEDELPASLSPIIHAKPPAPANNASIGGGNTVRDFDWNVVGEYDPMWPNEYDKVVKDMKERRDRREREEDRHERIERNERKRKSRFGDNDDVPEKQMIPMQAMEEEPTEMTRRGGGVAIAPPPSLQESSPLPPVVAEKPAASVAGYSGSSIAAKIMAKYGFKEGQGLGKKEQGMSVALQVEKTSKRGGRIIHEKDGSTTVMPPPPPNTFAMPAPPGSDSPVLSADNQPQKPEPSITEIMKSPSKVVLLRNMVGPGDVDDDLEPEVKDECNTKYGEVVKVVIYELKNSPSDEAVRIFVEFKRIESAIKAVVDLNGRFFGGRQVKAGFYSVEKFNAYELLE